MDVLRLRFDAPLMSFGGVIVDQHNITDRFPGRSLLAGLFGNALGLDHHQSNELNALQKRIEYAARWDIEPTAFCDYQTVDLGQDKMSLNRKGGWTTLGTPEWRDGGDARLGTHQRYRHYWANGVMTVAATLQGGETPSVAELGEALTSPARPLFLGRKTCLPSTPILLDRVEADNVLSALNTTPRAIRAGSPRQADMPACWPAALDGGPRARKVTVYDQRDWRNQVHTGGHARWEGLITEQAQ